MTPEQFSAAIHIAHQESMLDAIDEFPELNAHSGLLHTLVKAEITRANHQRNADNAADRVDQIEAELRRAVLGEAK